MIPAPDSLPPYREPPALTASLPDSSRPADMVPFLLPPVVVKASRRAVARPTEDPHAWTTPSALGLAGPLEALRSSSGTAFASDLSGQFSSCGMPTEGSVVTWEGVTLLWPWHFGGLFGALDDKATGSVRWQTLPGEASPARGGGWLETRSRAWGDTDAVHGSAQLGFVAGSLSSWGRKRDWGWQLGVRRTWLGAALELARDNGWTDQEMDVGFTDGSAALTWRHGPWKALIGYFGSHDTLGMVVDSTTFEYAWNNRAVPVKLGWESGDWSLEAAGGWSHFDRTDAELGSRDTLSLLSTSLDLGWRGTQSLSVRAGMRSEHWESRHDRFTQWILENTGVQPKRTRLSPHADLEVRKGRWVLHGWGGLDIEPGASALPVGGSLLTVRTGNWLLLAGAEHRSLPLSLLDQSGTGMDAASPAFVLPSGTPARSSQFQLEARTATDLPAARLSTRFSALAWLRLHDGLWGWHTFQDRWYQLSFLTPTRSDGWGRGVELKASLQLGRLEVDGRYILSQDVLQERGDSAWQAPSRWAPWDQRHRFEGNAAWTWIGPDHPTRDRFRWQSCLSGRASSGTPRNAAVGWTAIDPSRDLDTSGLPTWTKVNGPRRTPYLRLDLTPLRLGREGHWSIWWTLVNLGNEQNLSGWLGYRPGNLEPAYQIPFLPVVFGAQIEF